MMMMMVVVMRMRMRMMMTGNGRCCDDLRSLTPYMIFIGVGKSCADATVSSSTPPITVNDMLGR
jgi:hypothetical protein